LKEEAVPGAIICGVDESESAKGAGRVARALSSKLGRALDFVGVVELASSDEAIGAVVERLEQLSMDASEVDSEGWRGIAAADRDYAGGIVRFGLGGGTEFAGGIARFGLGPRSRLEGD
jgi:hypothetical protein